MTAQTNDAASQDADRQIPSIAIPATEWQGRLPEEDDADQAPEEAGYGYGV